MVKQSVAVAAIIKVLLQPPPDCSSSEFLRSGDLVCYSSFCLLCIHTEGVSCPHQTPLQYFLLVVSLVSFPPSGS